MKTLLDRLEPEIKYKLDKVNEQHPNTVDFVYEELDSKHNLGEISYATISYIVDACNLKDYSPRTISEIFR